MLLKLLYLSINHMVLLYNILIVFVHAGNAGNVSIDVGKIVIAFRSIGAFY